jgi:outer membrane biosynthesis protein TonB
MDHRNRIRRAFIISLIVHVVGIVVLAALPRSDRLTLGNSPFNKPITVTLQPPVKPWRLIEPGAPPDTPIGPSSTDLISERASKAQDLSDADGEGNAPRIEKVGETDQLGGHARPEEPVPAAPRQAPPPAPEPKAPAPQQKAGAPAQKVEDSPAPAPRAAEPKPAPEQAPEPIPAEQERVEMAKATLPQVPQPAPGKTQGRVEGGVKSKGFLSFEAMENEFAPYLREVRTRVEKRWKALMQLRYSGASSTKAVIDCAISPDGQLTYVTVVEAGDSATYAGLCKQAIEDSGPFPPFPFKVPEVYRSENIEIRWTFSFL